MAVIANIFIDQGTDFSVIVDCTDTVGNVLNLTGFTATAQIRKTYGSSSALPPSHVHIMGLVDKLLCH